VQADPYLLLCQRSIELNPVRAGLVSDPGDDPGSSYRANALGPPDAILSPHPIYLALATGEAQRPEVYSDLFRTALDEAPLADLRMALNQSQPLALSPFRSAHIANGSRSLPRFPGPGKAHACG